MFSIETEAVVLALALLERTGDAELQAAAKRVGDKIAGAVPHRCARRFPPAPCTPSTVPRQPEGIDLATVRRAIRDEETLLIDYRDEYARATERTIRPIALIYYSETANIVAWCELRQAIRTFRADRVEACAATGRFRGEGDGLRQLWISGWAENRAAG